MTEIWDEARVQHHIDDCVQEDIHLDYKSAGALGKQNDKRDGITKVVSAMANSDGGCVIYGVQESHEIPSHITPISRKEFRKDWLEQVIGNIHPNIEGVMVHSVTINDSNDDVVYVVEIPQSQRVHQATDKKFYKRYTSHSVPMEHFEILDVLNRQQHPRVALEFEVVHTHFVTDREWLLGSAEDLFDTAGDSCVLQVWARNRGSIYAKYVSASIDIPGSMLEEFEYDENIHFMFNGDAYCRYTAENVVRADEQIIVLGNVIDVPKVGQGNFQPILPELRFLLTSLKLLPDYAFYNSHHTVAWKVYADSASPVEGRIDVLDFEIKHRRQTVNHNS